MKFFDRIVPYLAVLLVGLFCAAIVVGCSGSQKKPALSTLECRVTLLEPYLGELTHDLVRSTLAGNVRPLVQALANLGLTPGEISEVSKAWNACKQSKPPSVPDAGTGPTGSGAPKIESF